MYKRLYFLANSLHEISELKSIRLEIIKVRIGPADHVSIVERPGPLFHPVCGQQGLLRHETPPLALQLANVVYVTMHLPQLYVALPLDVLQMPLGIRGQDHPVARLERRHVGFRGCLVWKGGERVGGIIRRRRSGWGGSIFILKLLCLSNTPFAYG